MSGLRNLFLAFFFGILVGSIRPVHHVFSALPSVRKINRFLIARTYPPVCEDLYATSFPVGKPQNLEEMGENFTPIPGTTHLTLGGYQHHGNRKVEMWYQTMAPGASTPIHSTASEVVFYFIDGEIHLSTRARDGSVVTHEMLPNSTTTVLSNARHQLTNPGPGDSSFIMAFDSPPMNPIFMFESWESKKGKPMGPLPWDTKCPGPPPPPPPPMDLEQINKELRGEL